MYFHMCYHVPAAVTLCEKSCKMAMAEISTKTLSFKELEQ